MFRPLNSSIDSSTHRINWINAHMPDSFTYIIPSESKVRCIKHLLKSAGTCMKLAATHVLYTSFNAHTHGRESINLWFVSIRVMCQIYRLLYSIHLFTSGVRNVQRASTCGTLWRMSVIGRAILYMCLSCLSASQRSDFHVQNSYPRSDPQTAMLHT